MSFETFWAELGEACDDLPAGATVFTPATDRAFAVTDVRESGVRVRFRDGEREGGRSRLLRRDGFAVLYHRLRELPDGLVFSDLSPGIEPYAALFALHPGYDVDEDAGALVLADGPTTARPFVVEPGTEGTGAEETGPDEAGTETGSAPAAVRADATLLVDLLDRHDAADPASLATDALVDLYVLLSDVQRGSDRLRRSVGDALLDRIDADRPVAAQFGSVRRTTRYLRDLRSDDAVLAALDDRGIPREWVLGVAPEKVDVVLSVTDLDEEAVYDVTEQVYVRKAEVAEAAKERRLQGLRDRLDGAEADADSEGLAALREEVERLEERIDAMLAGDRP